MNNTGVFFEILGMVVFAFILAVAHNNQGVGVIFERGQDREHLPVPRTVHMSFFLVAMFMSLFVIYGFDTASTLAEETQNPRQEAPKAVLAAVDRRVRHRRDLPVGAPDRDPGHGRGRRRASRARR